MVLVQKDQSYRVW